MLIGVNLQFTIQNSQFTIHNSQFTIHNSQFTIHNSKFTIQNSKFTITRVARNRDRSKLPCSADGPALLIFHFLKSKRDCPKNLGYILDFVLFGD
jgi:hypothetical protein